jgi:ABC-2 type transport system permease protein
MLKLFKKDLILFLHDQKAFILTFLIPIILITLFTFAYGGIGSYINEPDSFNLLAVDLDQSELSGEFRSVLDSLNGMNITDTDITEAERLINQGKYPGALVFHKGFQDSVLSKRPMPVEFMYDREKEPEIGRLQSVIINTLIYTSKKMEMQAYLEAVRQEQGPDQDTHLLPESSMDSKNSSFLKMTSVVGKRNDLNLGLIQAIAGTAILMLLFSVAGVGTSILEEKENGTINRLLYSPLNSKTILYSKMLFAFFVAILQLTVMFLFSWIFLHLDISVNPWALVLMIISTAFAVSSIGIFLAAIAKSRQQAQSLSTLVILIMSAIGGSMIPLFIMPDIMSRIAIFSVNYWGIQGFYDIFWRLLPLSEILPRIFILSGTGIVLTIISIKLFKKTILNMV